MKKNKALKRAVTGYAAFFVLSAAAVTAAVFIYDAARQVYGERKGTIAAVMFAVCLGLSLLCTTIDALRRKFTVDRSVEEILEATERITSGDFRVRLCSRHSFKKHDDLDEIMENLNKMAEELSKNEVLKTDFIANVSHEIKTPLSVIQNYATALQNDFLDQETKKKYLSALTQASARLTALVTNILKLNKLENQRFSPELETVRLEETLAQTIFDFEDLIERKSIDLHCDVDEVCVKSCASYLELVWNNLLSNAVKFTPVGGKITISLKEKNGKAVVRIADTGCGMNEETGLRIFDKFYQGDTSHAKEGNGLGLALVKKVIDILGGEIAVESEKGKGSVFTVTLSGASSEER